MKKVITVLGARPQFIKAAPLSKAFKSWGNMQEILVHTGQHYDRGMSKIFFDELQIPEPDYHLNVGSGSHAFQTGEIMKMLEDVLIQEKPDILVIFGDTNSTLAGALTAAKLHIPIAHVEAGLRSFNRIMPEEINRIIADTLSSLLFAPTTSAVKNLAREGITQSVVKTGDIMYDVALQFRKKAHEYSGILDTNKLTANEYVLATVHRAENTSNSVRLGNIVLALEHIAQDIKVVLPLHPRTKKMIQDYHLVKHMKRITVLPPVGFLDMIHLEKNAKVIITDSGGVQKEAYFQKVPCVTLRDETEWVETVHAGWNVLADVSSQQNIISCVTNTIDKNVIRQNIEEYGDGNTAPLIVQELKQYLNSH